MLKPDLYFVLIYKRNRTQMHMSQSERASVASLVYISCGNLQRKAENKLMHDFVYCLR